MAVAPLPAPPKQASRPPAPPPPVANGGSPPPPRTRSFVPSIGVADGPQKVGIYGSGGIGKSELAASIRMIGKRPLILDIEDSAKEIGIMRLGRADGLCTWNDMRSAINDSALWKPYDTVIIDTLTRTQDECGKDIQGTCDSLASACGGYGKGFRKLYDSMLLILGDLEAHINQGREVILIMHEFVVETPNPDGEDYKTYMPNLYMNKEVSVRHRVKEWLDHLFFVGYDVIAKDGKGKGSGTRTIYTSETPTHWAKTRRSENFAGPILYKKGSCELWERLYGVTANAEA